MGHSFRVSRSLYWVPNGRGTMLHSFLETIHGVFGTIRYWMIGMAIFTVAEFIYPAERDQPWKDKLVSCGYSVIGSFALPFVVYLPNRFIAQPIFAAMGHPIVTLNLDSLAGTGWSALALKNLVFPFAPIFVLDFFYYWTHRLQHTLPFLWAQHKLHHMEYSLCAATNFRHHWLEEGVRVFTLWIPMGVLIKVTGGADSFIMPAIAYWNFFIHANIKLPMGFLTKVLEGPQVHRIHHSSDPRHYDRNFAAFFPIWDIIFGSYCHPEKGEWPATGMVHGERPRSFVHGLFIPFDGIIAKLKRRNSAIAAEALER